MTFVKICGLTNFADTEAALSAGADYLGFIFYEKSPRKADPDTVARIMQAFDAEDRYRTLIGVGVFVGPTPHEVKRTLAHCGLKAAQVHNVNCDELCAIQKATYGVAFSAVRPRTLDEALTCLPLVDVDTGAFRPPRWTPQLLMDAYHPDLYGGTGQRADFDVAREMTKRVSRLVLAGGLTPDNVGDAIRSVRPWAVDVASGVEAAPGKKDHGKVKAFIDAVREADKESVA